MNLLNLFLMIFTLPTLPYASNALEPVISEQTIQYHYGKHHQTYVDNLNNLIIGTPFANADLETIIKKSDGAIFNNAAQVWNHTFYFMQFSPHGGGQPTRHLAEAILKKWGTFDLFVSEFNKTALSVFGSGWVWLVKTKAGELEIQKTGNAENPIIQGNVPILTFDVWEHAYYLDYQNRRGDYSKALWNIIDWNVVSKRF